jgi:hypothetical protein
MAASKIGENILKSNYSFTSSYFFFVNQRNYAAEQRESDNFSATSTTTFPAKDFHG